MIETLIMRYNNPVQNHSSALHCMYKSEKCELVRTDNNMSWLYKPCLLQCAGPWFCFLDLVIHTPKVFFHTFFTVSISWSSNCWTSFILRKGNRVEFFREHSWCSNWARTWWSIGSNPLLIIYFTDFCNAWNVEVLSQKESVVGPHFVDPFDILHLRNKAAWLKSMYFGDWKPKESDGVQ